MLDSTPTVFSYLLSGDNVVLDYGSGRGALLQDIGTRIRKGVGIELDERLVDVANRTNRFDHVGYIMGDGRKTLPFEAASFDIIFAIGVLEHLGDEKPYLREFHRLLRPEGSLVIEVPARGPFRVLDIGNIKYNFPRLHRWFYYYVARQPEYYEKNFAPDAPMFGQFTRDATEHRHYSVEKLKEIADPYFLLERYELVSFFFELIQFVEVLVCKPFGRSAAKVFTWLIKHDSRIKAPLGRAYFVGVFRKKA